MPLAQQISSTENDDDRVVKIFCYASFVLVGIINTFFGPILPFLYEKWQLDDVRAGYFLAAQSLGGLSGTLITSFFYSRLNSKQILTIGYAVIIISLFGLGIGNWEIGLFSSLLSGIGLGIIIPTTTLIVSKAAAENRSAAINLLNFFWALGAVSSPLIFFGLRSAAHLNYLLAAISLSAAIVLAVLFKLKNVRIASKTEKSTGGAKKSAILLSVWFLVVTLFLQVGIESSMSGWLPIFAKRISSSELWLLVPTFYWTGFLSSRLISSFYLRIVGEKAVILCGLLLVIGGQLIFLLTAQINAAAVGSFLVGFGTAPIFPVVIAILSGKFEKKAPELLSYMFLLSGLGGMTFSWLIGYAAAVTGELKTALLIPLMCAFLLFFLHLFTRRTSV